MLELGINVDIFSSQLETMHATDDKITVRTKEPVPFMGDYIAVEVTMEDVSKDRVGNDVEPGFTSFYDLFMNEDTEDFAESFENDKRRETVIYRGADKIQKQLRDYITETLNCQAVQLNQEPFKNLYVR